MEIKQKTTTVSPNAKRKFVAMIISAMLIISMAILPIALSGCANRTPDGGDNSGTEQTPDGGDNTGGDNTGGDNTGGDNTGGDNTGGEDINIADVLTIENSVITGLKDKTVKVLNIPSEVNGETVTGVGSYAISGCNNLQKLILPDTITSIDVGAFYLCPELTEIRLSENIENLPKNALRECSKLRTVSIPSKVKSIGENAFYKCSALESIDIPDGVTALGIWAFAECGNLSSAKIGNGITVLPKYLFYKSAKLSQVNISENITEIGEYALSRTGLAEVKIPSSIKKAEYYAFSYCDQLNKVTFEEGSANFPYMFLNCKNLETAEFPDSVVQLANGIFSGCEKLKNVSLPKNLTTLGSSAFKDCKSLQSINIPRGLTSVYGGDFSGCDALGEIVVEDGNSKYYSEGNCLIDKTSAGWKKIAVGCANSIIPTDVKSISSYAFAGRTSIRELYIPANVEFAGTNAFTGCTNIEKVTCSTDVIGDIPKAKLHTVILNGSNQGSCGYIGGKSLKHLTLLKEVTASILADQDLGNSENLETITVEEGNPSYFSVNNCLIGKAGLHEKRLVAGCKNSILPNDGSITKIGQGAFKGCTGLTSISIPESVTVIVSQAFMNCIALTEIKIPQAVTDIGENAFSGCVGLTSVKIPSNVCRIGENAFAGCDNLTSVVFEYTANWQTTDDFSYLDYEGKYPITVTDAAANAENFKVDKVKHHWINKDKKPQK